MTKTKTKTKTKGLTKTKGKGKRNDASAGSSTFLFPLFEVRELHRLQLPREVAVEGAVWENIDLDPPPGMAESLDEVRRMLVMEEELAANPTHQAIILREAGLDLTAYTRPIGIEDTGGYDATKTLFLTVLKLTEYIGLIYKDRFNRPRPNQIDPRLRPLLPNPPHASYPSNHSFQSFTIADIFAEIYRGRSKGDELRAEGVVGQLVVLTKPSAASVEAGHGPVVLLGVITPVPADAIQQLEIVVADFVRELADRQQGANPSMTVTAAIAASSTQPTLVAGSRLRSALGWVLLGVIVGLLSYAAAERWLPHATGHRRNRQLTTRFAPKLHFREH